MRQCQNSDARPPALHELDERVERFVRIEWLDRATADELHKRLMIRGLMRMVRMLDE